MALGVSVPWLKPFLQPDSAYIGPFRDNVQDFLKRFGTKVSIKGLKRVSAWVVPLTAESGCSANLHVYEERTSEEKDKVSVCDCCRNMGERHVQGTAAHRNSDPAPQGGRTTPYARASTISSSPRPRPSPIRTACRPWSRPSSSGRAPAPTTP